MATKLSSQEQDCVFELHAMHSHGVRNELHDVTELMEILKIPSERDCELIIEKLESVFGVVEIADDMRGLDEPMQFRITSKILALTSELRSEIRDAAGVEKKEIRPLDLHEIPTEIRDSLRNFQSVYPNADKQGFVMMKFGESPAHTEILKGIRQALSDCGMTALRADDRQFHDDLYYNIMTYIYGCSFGIAVFERILNEDFNPNVSLEVGIMLGLRKPVCLLKDSTLKLLHTDMVGKLYRPFDPQRAAETIPGSLLGWIKDKGIPLQVEPLAQSGSMPSSAVAQQTEVSSGAAKYLMAAARPRSKAGIPLSVFDAFASRESEEMREYADELFQNGFLRIAEAAYLVTGRGYRFADQLWQVHILRVIKTAQSDPVAYVETDEIARLAVLNDGHDEAQELQRHLKELAKNKLIEPVRSEGSIVGARLTTEGQTHLLHHAEWDFGTIF